MEKKWINSERVVSIVAFIFLVIAFFASIALNGDPDSVLELIPHGDYVLTAILLPIIHGITAVWCFYQIFRPSLFGEAGIMIIESCVTIMTGTELLGIFLFYGAICLIQISLAEKLKHGRFVYICVAVHFLLLFTTLSHGIAKFALYVSCSAFYLSFLLWIYHLIRVKFTYFLPKTILKTSVIKETPGSTIHLKDFGFTERQIGIIQDYIYNKVSYKELAEKYITSLSSIKKDFSIVFQKLGVSNIQEMSFLLMQYHIEP